MAYKIVYTVDEFLKKQFDLADNRGTTYCNKYPKNLLYRQAPDLYSADCWNEIKAQLWGFTPEEPIGTYVAPNLSIGLGDWNGWTILQCCNRISTNLKACIPGEFLLSTNKGHAGTYIGDTIRNGKVYNVLECTSDWKSKFQYSWMDPATGYRYEYKGAPTKMKTVWGWHGELPWIDYKVEPTEVIAVDGSWGMATTRYTQKMLGLNIDGIISSQPRTNKRFLPAASTASWEFKLIGAKGSETAKAIQKLIGADVDGYFGKGSVTSLQKFLKGKGFYDSSIDGYMGANTVKGWQRYINAYFRGK